MIDSLIIRLLFIILSLSSTVVFSQIELPSIFTDNMVLQQNSEVAIWGWSSENSDISISTSWNNKKYKTTSNNNGKWKISIPTPSYGGPFTITFKEKETTKLNNILIGDVWLCAGQSNMEMPMKGFKGQPITGSNNDILRSKNKNIRLITIPRNSTTEPQTNFNGNWNEATPSTVANFSATGYYFGKLLNDITDIPIGLVCVSYGGSCIEAWMSKETSQPFKNTPIPKTNDTIKSKNRTPTVLFNGMLSPVIGYNIKGAIWYQGETNYQNANEYARLFKTMVGEWRQKWNIGDFPFYYAQIAPFDYSVFTPNDSSELNNSAYLRDAQRIAMDSITNSGMAVLLDQGDKTNIHPPNKRVAGERLAYWALAKTYLLDGFGYASPTVNELNIKDSTITVTFTNIPNGITSYNKEVTLFEVAGEDQVFHPAKCKVRRKSVVLHSSTVKNPVAVRYAFKNYVEAQIFNTEGLPLTSFRTDNWEY